MSTTGDAAADAAAAQAAQEAFRRTTIEIWTLYGVAVASTVLRTYARVRAVGWKGLAADDYLVWVGVVSRREREERPQQRCQDRDSEN